MIIAPYFQTEFVNEIDNNISNFGTGERSSLFKSRLLRGYEINNNINSPDFPVGELCQQSAHVEICE